MCNSAAKLYMEAERCFVIGDHERSYVLFGKYFKTILPLKKRDDYRRQKTELDAILGPQSKQLRAIEIMTELRDNLVDRYDKMKTKTSVATPTENPLPLGQDNDRTRSDCKTRSFKFYFYLSSSSIPLAASRLIKSCFDLRRDLHSNDILLIDCRPHEDYEQSRLRSADVLLHIPDEKLQMGMTAWKVGAALETDRDRAMWASRATRKEIILMDWSSQGPDAVRGSSLWILKDIMLNVSDFIFHSY